jgi:DNA-binding transcriptional LysR family regulator
VSLFDRSVSGIQLTAEGARLVPAIREVCELKDQVFGTSGRDREVSLVRRPLGLASVNFVQLCLAIPLAQRVAAEHPDQRFRFMEVNPDELLPQGVRGAFDICLHLGKLDWPRIWSSRKIGTLAFALFGKAGHVLGPRASEKDILRHFFIVPTYWSEGRFVPGNDQCPLPIQRRNWNHQATTAMAALEAVALGNALAFAPEIAAQSLVSRGHLQKIEVAEWPPVQRELYLSVHTERVRQTVHRSFLKNLKGMPDLLA